MPTISLLTKLHRINSRYGRFFLLEFLLFPLTSLFWNTRALINTIHNSRVLINGQRDRYLNYRSAYAINMLFYWTQAEHFRRWGRFGVSPYLGPGNLHLAHWFHLTLPSSYLFRAFGVVLTITAMTFWWLSQMVWLETIPTNYWMLVTLPALLSTTFFAQTFVVQNYNALGWMFMPFSLWGMMAGHPVISSLALFAASFGSITTVFIGCIISASYSFEAGSFIPVLIVAPATLKVLGQIVYCQMKVTRNAVFDVAKVIGLTKIATKYIRSKCKLLTSLNILLFTPHIIFIIACFYLGVTGSWSYLVVFVFLVLNETSIIRCADTQSFQIGTFSLSTAMVIQAQNPLLIIPYWLLINPLPLFLGINATNDHPLRAPILRPFDIGKIVDSVDSFFAVVRPGQRVLFAFKDPEGRYESLFDGYRVILESAAYVAARRTWHLLPDWYFVMHYNNPDSPDCWGVEPDAVHANVAKWNADYVVIYSTTSETGLQHSVDPYEVSGLKFTGVILDWGKLIDNADDTPWFNQATPVWKLYKARN